MAKAIYFLILSLICGIVTGYVHPQWAVNDYFAAGSFALSAFLYLFGVLHTYDIDKIPIYNDSVRKRVRRNNLYFRRGFAYMFFATLFVYFLTAGKHQNPYHVFGVSISLDYFGIMMVWWAVIYFGYNLYLVCKLKKDLKKALDSGSEYDDNQAID